MSLWTVHAKGLQIMEFTNRHPAEIFQTLENLNIILGNAHDNPPACDPGRNRHSDETCHTLRHLKVFLNNARDNSQTTGPGADRYPEGTCRILECVCVCAVSYTHLTLPTS